MFEVRFHDGNEFKKLVEALKDFKEINLECSDRGINLKVMDDCHVSLADMYLSPSMFEIYHCEAPCRLGLNIETLQKLIRLAPNNAPLTLRKEVDADRLRMESEDAADMGLKRAADISLIHITGDGLQVPKQQYYVKVEIPTKIYAHLMKDLSSIGEDITITVTQNIIKFESDGEKGRVQDVFQRGQGAFINTAWHFEPLNASMMSVSQAFALRFLSNISKACPLSETLLLCMAPGVPLCLQFLLPEKSYISFYIAPALD